MAEKFSSTEAVKKDGLPECLHHGTMGPIQHGWHEAKTISFQLEAVFSAIHALTLGQNGPVLIDRIRRLAEVGEYQAFDKGNFFDCQQEAAGAWESSNAKS